MIYEPLRKEAGEKALNYAVLKMELDNTVIDTFRGFEYHGADGSIFAPLKTALSFFGWLAECIDGIGPGRVAALPGFDVREDVAGMAIGFFIRLQRLSSKHFQGT